MGGSKSETTGGRDVLYVGGGIGEVSPRGERPRLTLDMVLSDAAYKASGAAAAILAVDCCMLGEEDSHALLSVAYDTIRGLSDYLYTLEVSLPVEVWETPVELGRRSVRGVQ